MQAFVEFLRAKESWLMERILGYAQKFGYTPFTSTLIEAWRISIVGLTEAIAAALSNGSMASLEITAQTRWDDDPAVLFGVQEARKHRKRGISLGMFLGLFIYYRQSYQDVLHAFVADGDTRHRLEYALVRIFDRMGTAFCVEWATMDDQTAVCELSASMRSMTNEKNRYLTFFESLAVPVIFLDAEVRIDNLNCAAAQLINEHATPGASYYTLRSEISANSLCGKYLLDVFPWLASAIENSALAGIDPEREALTAPNGRRYRVAVRTLEDFSGRMSGHSLVLHDETEILRTQDLIVRAKEEVERTFDTISDLVFLVDDSGNMVRVNKALADKLGVRPRDVVGRSCREVMGCSGCIQPGGSCANDTEPVAYTNISGRYLVNRNRLASRDGQSFGCVFVARDITTLERVQRTLHAVESKYKNIFDNATEGIFQSTPGGRFVSLNPSMAAMLGFASTAEAMDYFTDIPHQLYACPEDRQRIIDKLHAGGVVRNLELQLRRRSGTLFWALVNVRLVPDANGDVAYFEGFVQDVTELRHFVRELEQSEQRIRRLLETMSQGLVQIDTRGLVAYCNEFFCTMLGRASGEILGYPLEEQVLPADRPALTEALSSWRSNLAARRYDLRWNAATGEVYSIVTLVELLATDGAREGFWLLVMDVTGRKLLEAQLLQTQKLEAIGQLAAGIAHEINTPTQYVLNNTIFLHDAFARLTAFLTAQDRALARMDGVSQAAQELLKLKVSREENQVDFYLDELEQAFVETQEGLERITSIVNSVKQFAHPGQDEWAPASLNDIVRNTANVSRNEWKYVAEMDLDLDPDLPPVSCAGHEIGQVVLNLVVNAAQAIGSQSAAGGQNIGRILLTSRRMGGWAEIRVQDSGGGIPEAIRERIFEPFFTTKPVGQGTGQGLFIAHQIIAKHGGSMHFESTVGQGTTFVIRLPLHGRPADPNLFLE